MLVGIGCVPSTVVGVDRAQWRLWDGGGMRLSGLGGAGVHTHVWPTGSCGVVLPLWCCGDCGLALGCCLVSHSFQGQSAAGVPLVVHCFLSAGNDFSYLPVRFCPCNTSRAKQDKCMQHRRVHRSEPPHSSLDRGPPFREPPQPWWGVDCVARCRTLPTSPRAEHSHPREFTTADAGRPLVAAIVFRSVSQGRTHANGQETQHASTPATGRNETPYPNDLVQIPTRMAAWHAA